MTMMLFFGICCITAIISPTSGYKYFQDRIPNGDNVLHTCFVNIYWAGVGHFNQNGGGALNPFGVDFKNAGSIWKKELCLKDSDGDGMTNGQELGDPACVWSAGKVPARTSNISNPGVCEPIDSSNCLAKNRPGPNICQKKEFVCNDTKKPNVTTIDIRIKETVVPNKVTNYYCQAFTLPSNDTHLIAIEPIINNTNVMHHILLFGCSVAPSASHFTNSYQCGMGGVSCNSIIGGWTLGSSGECFKNHSGVRIGTKGFQYVVLQVHWNNPRQISTYKDSSGLKLYLTTSLRAKDSGILLFGQRYLAIPPGSSSYLQEGYCSSNCTKRHLPHPIYIQSVLPHMHNAGRYSQISIYRNNKNIKDLIPYKAVRYDDPQMIEIDPPVELKPGDQLHLKCVYKTRKEKNMIYYGEATADEMCYGFIRYFPAQRKLNECLNYGPVDLCTLYDKENGGDGKYVLGRIGNCSSIGIFMHTMTTVWAPQLNEHCDYSMDVCRAACKNVIMRLNQEPCYQGWAKKYIQFLSVYWSALKKFRLQTMACSIEIEREMNLRSTTAPPMTTTPSIPSGEFQLKEYQVTILIAVGCALIGLIIITGIALLLYKVIRGRCPSENITHLKYQRKTDVPFENNYGYNNKEYY